MPVYKLLGGPVDPRGVRGYYHTQARNKDELMKLRGTAVQQGVSCFKSGIPGYYEWIETHQKIDRAVKGMQLLREGLGPDIDIVVTPIDETNTRVRVDRIVRDFKRSGGKNLTVEEVEGEIAKAFQELATKQEVLV